MNKAYDNKILTIIVPVYNVEKTLERAVNSIIKSYIADIEVILVDDGSTDGSGKIADTFEVSYPDVIRTYHKNNGGLASARNFGLEKARSSYVAFLDSDDFYINNILDDILDIIKESQPDIVTFGFARGNSLENCYELVAFSDHWLIEKDVIAAPFKDKSIDFYAWNKVWKKNLFDEVKFPEGRLYEDIMPTYKLFNKVTRVFVLAKPGVFYFQNPQSIVNQKFKPAQYDNVLQREELLEDIRKTNPQIYQLALEKLTDGFLSTGFKIAQSTKEAIKINYIKVLKTDIRRYKKQIMESHIVEFQKKIGITLLLINCKIFALVYRIRLNK
ncbi:glycosyltransferase family 2 protein [Enterococcus malodoratus]|uniref:glycosyltransferase family 2 protein n=1 Tax=Enterococcus malodoratus TaxID=71451 RepID=UPI003FD5C4A6